jgi:hypothetical protein
MFLLPLATLVLLHLTLSGMKLLSFTCSQELANIRHCAHCWLWITGLVISIGQKTTWNSVSCILAYLSAGHHACFPPMSSPSENVLLIFLYFSKSKVSSSVCSCMKPSIVMRTNSNGPVRGSGALTACVLLLVPFHQSLPPYLPSHLFRQMLVLLSS